MPLAPFLRNRSRVWSSALPWRLSVSGSRGHVHLFRDGKSIQIPLLHCNHYLSVAEKSQGMEPLWPTLQVPGRFFAKELRGLLSGFRTSSVPAVEVPVSTRVELPPEPVKEIPPMELPIAIPTEEENKPVEIIAVEEKKFSLTKALAEASRPAEAVKSVELPKAKPMTKLAATKTKIEVPKLFETKPVQGIETDKTAVAKSIFADAPVVVEEKKEKVVKKKVVENVNAFVTFKKIEVVYL